jgi:hypothetical protein
LLSINQLVGPTHYRGGDRAAARSIGAA